MYDENYKPNTPSAEELSAAYSAANEVLEKEDCRILRENTSLRMKNLELETEKEKLVTDNLNLMAAVAELSSEIERLKENQWGTSFADS
jgi:hypothetical protein